MIREMSEYGMNIGSHSLSHKDAKHAHDQVQLLDTRSHPMMKVFQNKEMHGFDEAESILSNKEV